MKEKFFGHIMTTRTTLYFHGDNSSISRAGKNTANKCFDASNKHFGLNKHAHAFFSSYSVPRN